jgi:hypothetical protein
MSSERHDIPSDTSSDSTHQPSEATPSSPTVSSGSEETPLSPQPDQSSAPINDEGVDNEVAPSAVLMTPDSDSSASWNGINYGERLSYTIFVISAWSLL